MGAASPPWRPLWRWLVPLALAALVWLVPHGRFEPRTWGLLCAFVFTVVGMIAQPLPGAAVVLVGITAANLLGFLSLPEALAGFANATVWLIVSAFVFARGFLITGLGERIAYGLIAAFGGSSLRLGYALVLADLSIAPVTPSNTARAGGVIFPVALSVAHALDSRPGPTAERLGAFLLKTAYQADLVVSALFLTSMAANPLVAELARQASGVTISWGRWLLASIGPGLVGLVLVPLVVYRLCPPEVRLTENARAMARAPRRDASRRRCCWPSGSCSACGSPPPGTGSRALPWPTSASPSCSCRARSAGRTCWKRRGPGTRSSGLADS
jgi:DASS family divalent anion:Na+ symporter